MSSRAQFNSPEAIERRLREGRGQGVGPHYIPWIQIYDFPSWGLRFRAYSHIPQRAMHTLSMLEHHNVALAEDEDGIEDLLAGLIAAGLIALRVKVRRRRNRD